jgi:hypothetical protein
LRSQAKYQFVDSEHGLSFSYACFFDEPQVGTDSPLYPYSFTFYDYRKKNFDKPEYTIEVSYLTGNELAGSDASFCSKHLGDKNCKTIKVDNIDATAYYTGIFNKSELATVPNPKGGAITFLLHPLTTDSQVQLDDMLNTFHFGK